MENQINLQARNEAKEIWEKELKNNFSVHMNNCLINALNNLQTQLKDFGGSMKTHIQSINQKYEQQLKEKNEEINQQSQDNLFKPNPFSIIGQDNQDNQQNNQNDDDILRKKHIDLNMINMPSLKILNMPELANPLVNLILYCFANFKTFLSYYFGEKNEEKIIKKPNILGPAFLKLIDNYWKSQINQYSTKEIHYTLHNILENTYFTQNPGLIFSSILNILSHELHPFKPSLINSNLNKYNENEVWMDFINTCYNNQTKIKNSFFVMKEIIKKCQSCNSNTFYMYNGPIITLYLEPNPNIFNNLFFLLNHFDSLLISPKDRIINEFCQKCRFQTNQYVTKYILSPSEIIIFDINRDSDPNNIVSFNYPTELYSQNIIKKNLTNSVNVKYELFSIIRKIQVNNSQQYILHCKNFVNGFWYSYNNKEIKIENYPVMDLKNVCLLIYYKSSI